MMKKMLLLTTLAVVVSCETVPDGFCECMEISERLDGVANQVLLGNDGEDKANELIKLRQEKAAICADFSASSGEDMMRWKKSCED